MSLFSSISVDCSLSRWSEWSGCNLSCKMRASDVSNRTRERHVGEPARHGGQPCLGAVDDVEICENIDICPGNKILVPKEFPKLIIRNLGNV